MKFDNDIEQVTRWFENNGASVFVRYKTGEAERLAKIAGSCMMVCEPQEGDASLVGFFLYDKVENAGDFDPIADAITFICGGRAAIGIRHDVFSDMPENYIIELVLHEVDHLRTVEHNESFSCLHLSLLQRDWMIQRWE